MAIDHSHKLWLIFYFFVFMLIRPGGLTLDEIFFYILPVAARLERLVSVETKEY